ncbi:MAG TPA: diacylglycerol kinase family protein, partial [Chloroflexota bacterium]|nr:diacylglycerol kinase family protein [Chloroflexota bacterium]
HLDVSALDPPPRVVLNPRAGQKLGLSTNAATTEAVEQALQRAGIRYELFETQAPRHATELAEQAVRDGCKLVIAGGGDGTIAEAAEGLADSDSALGIMPLGSIMNMARTLCIPRDLRRAAEVIADGRVLAMDAGRVADHYFLEAGGVGLAAGLFGYFERVDTGRVRLRGALRGGWRFLTNIGTPRMRIEVDGEAIVERTPMVTVSNGPFVGAAYALAPRALVDDGLLDVVIFRRASAQRVLLHMLLVAGGRRLPPPPDAQVLHARTVRVAMMRRRPLPVHADGSLVGTTPATFEVLPASLKVLVGRPEPGAACAWATE